jgi:5-methylcytosine-specific restriction endonuclease McrA
MNPPTYALLLNADYQPIKVISWKRAIELLLEQRADAVEDYVDRFVRSAKMSTPWPAVVRLRRYVEARTRMRFSRQNVLARDGYQCAYCGEFPKSGTGRPILEDLTIDHVIPRAHAKNGMVRLENGTRINVTCWENVVCACGSCNLKKADRTPGQAGMRLLFKPRTPSMTDILRMHLRKVVIPEEWKTWLPEGAEGWRGYWTEELEES